MSKERQLLTIAQLHKEAEKTKKDNKVGDKLASGMGVVVDCSAAYRYEANRDYVQKLKVVDGSAGGEGIQVYLYSNKKEELASSLKVGDVLLFNNFKIELYNDQLQAKKAYKQEDSYFRIFSGNPELQQYSPVDKKVGLDDEDGKVLATLNNLRNFSKGYFKNNKVPLLFKSKDKKQASSDFDMILRVQECETLPNHYKLRLTNDKEEFHLNYPRHVEPGVYKVRSIAETKWEDRICHLAGNDYTFFLQISSWMLSYDPKEWDRLAASPESKQKKQRRPKIECKATGAGKKLPKVSLKDLFGKDEHKEEVRVVCEVMDVLTSFEKAIKKYDKENFTEKSTVSETGQYIYSIHLLLSDSSMEGEVCNAYVYTFDGRGLEFLPELNPSGIYGRNLLDSKEHYDTFVNRLVEESDLRETPLELVLSPLFNGKETIYRIVDTQLLF